MGEIILTALQLTIKGWSFYYLWNSFLIGWAGASVPNITFWHSVGIAFLMTLVVGRMPTWKDVQEKTFDK